MLEAIESFSSEKAAADRVRRAIRELESALNNAFMLGLEVAIEKTSTPGSPPSVSYEAEIRKVVSL